MLCRGGIPNVVRRGAGKGGGDLGTLAVVFKGCQVGGVYIRIAEDAPIFFDKGHACVSDFAQSARQGLPVGIGLARVYDGGGTFGHQLKAHVQVLTDAIGQASFDGWKKVKLRHSQRNDDEGECHQKYFRARAHVL